MTDHSTTPVLVRAERERRRRTTEVECICGALIYSIDLPPDLRELSGSAVLWLHDHGDIYCYPDNDEAFAEPSESGDSEVRTDG